MTGKKIFDISAARTKKAKISRQYTGDPIPEWDAGARSLWEKCCRDAGKTISFEEWMFAEDENGMSPFEAGVPFFVSRDDVTGNR